jgi:hypothetical protein
MNIPPAQLEQLILTRLFGAQSVTGYDPTPGAEAWTVRVPTESGFWQADVDKLRAVPGVEVTEVERTGEAVTLRVRFALVARIAFGA